ELVYTGLVRSFLMASTEHAPLAGRWTRLIGENFATMADVHRVLGSLLEGADLMATADGREKSAAASRMRIARMLGCDATDADADIWVEAARWFAEAQIRAVTDGARLVLSQGTLPADAPVVVAGIGSAVLHEVARRLARRCVVFDTLLDVAPDLRERACA